MGYEVGFTPLNLQTWKRGQVFYYLSKKHPALEDTCDTVLSLLSGSFALLAVGFVWIKELVGRKKSKKD